MNNIRTICKRLLTTSINNIPNKQIGNQFENIKYNTEIISKMSLRPYRVSIEGNIGAGKTTVINYYSQFSSVETYAEPIHWWRDLDGHNLLDLLYKDINKWYNVFQKYVQLTRLKIQTMKPTSPDTKTQIFERSVQNNRYTFVEHAFSDGYLKGPEYEVFIQWFEWIRDNIDIEIDYIVYLRTTPEVVYERIKARGRSEENTLPFEYIKKLHSFHDKWLLGESNLINKNKLLVIDADQTLENVLQQCEDNKHLILSENLIPKNVQNKLF